MSSNNEKKSDVYKLISHNVRTIRKNKKLTQAQLAEKSHYSHEFVRRIEAPNSKKNFSIDTVSHLADALEVDIKKLFEEPEKKDNNKN